MQDAWLRFARARDSAMLREPLHYLYRIVRNLAIDGNRRASIEAERHLVDVDGIAGTVASDAPSPEDVVLARNELDFIRSALAELPERTRIAVEMHRFGGHKMADIARSMGISIGLVHALVADGIKHCHRRRNGDK